VSETFLHLGDIGLCESASLAAAPRKGVLTVEELLKLAASSS